MPLENLRIQYAVGQGSFHAAHVTYTEPATAPWRFDYVYDCGALSGRAPSRAVLRAVDHYEPRTEGGVSILDALVLSHYDSDHINAAYCLANEHEVRRVFVPYLSPEQLLLEIAKAASTIDGVALDALYAGAFGARLWGSAVVRVARGWRPGDDGNEEFRTTDGGEPPDPPRRGEDQAQFGETQSFQAVVERTGQQLGAVLDDRDAVAICAPGRAAVWRFKFWNYCLDDEELFAMAAVLLDSIGFPLHALETVGGAEEVLLWLANRTNRDAAVAAYRTALTEYSKVSPPARHVANLCSLALFSGAVVGEPPLYWGNAWQWRWWPQRTLHSWIGTGDALLGEPDVWLDFEAHYQNELPRVGTVLIPHHGAAPRGGPGFYNPGLNGQPGVMCVISAGAANTYGHPRLKVIEQVLGLRGHVEVVTENMWPGLLERCEWN